MTTPELEILSRVPTFAGLAAPALASVRATLEPLRLEAGELLVELGETSDELYVLAEGALLVDVDHGEGQRWQRRLEAPVVVGEMQLLFGGKRTATLRAAESVRLLRWRRVDFEACALRHPEVLRGVLELAHARLQREARARALRTALGPGGEALRTELLDRSQTQVLEPGEFLHRAGEPVRAWSIVVHGALVINRGSQRIAELGPGSSLGERELAARSPVPHTVTALSRTELLCIDAALFDELLGRHPAQLCALVARAGLAELEGGPPASHRRLVVFGASPSTELGSFCRALAEQLRAFGPVTLCDRKVLEAQGLAPSSDSLATRELSWGRARLWLESRAQRHEQVLVAVEHEDEALAELARGWGDHLVVLADANAGSAVSRLERNIAASAWEQRTLILLQPRSASFPSGTAAWLDARELDLHLHVRRGEDSHLARVARHLLRRPVCLALAGGGGRGFAHLGVARVLEDQGVPIDAICGVSSGAMIGAALAAGRGAQELIETYRRLTSRALLLRPVLPLMALVSPQPLVETVTELYGELDIEDLWLPFCCNAANLTRRRMQVFERGSVARSVLASCALPGILPPVVIDQELFVDGATLLNVPTRLARERWGGSVITVELGTLSKLGWEGDALPSPLRGLISYLSPRRNSPPSLTSTMLSALSVGVDEQNLDGRAGSDLLVVPEVQDYPITDFRSLDVMVELGAQAAERALADWEGGPRAAPRCQADRGSSD